MIGVKRTVVSVVVSVILVATAVASMWLMASAGVFTGAEQPLPGAPEPSDVVAAVEESGSTVPIASGFQAAQPRNPFEPLLEQTGGDNTTTTLDDESSSTTTAGDGSTTTTTEGDGSSTTSSSSTTTTTVGDSPDGTRVLLLEVRDESGSLVAVVEVDGETSTVGVGDSFAENFKVVSLTESGGVFTFGDSAFTLAVGQSILK
jgi:hypothetical protein